MSHMRSILIVEDEKNQRVMLSRAVREAEFDAQTASTGTEAISIMNGGPLPGIVILDLNLPDMTGLELADVIHQRWPMIQFIILTGYSTLEAAQQAIRLDVVDFLLKPTTLGELESAIARAWQKHLRDRPLPKIQETKVEAPAPPAGKTSSIAEVERDLIFAALERHDGNRTAAATRAVLSSRCLRRAPAGRAHRQA